MKDFHGSQWHTESFAYKWASRRGDTRAMNGAGRGRRLASPVRVTLACQLGSDLDGAWWPHTASLANELPELTDALSKRLGRINDISINWSSLAGSPDFDSLNRPRLAVPVRTIAQRIMTVTGSKALAKLLVIPSRTSAALAVMVLRRAADLPIPGVERVTEPFLSADQIVRTARAESAQCAQRLGEPAPCSPRSPTRS
ncbi:MAG: hypothetical protein QOC58_1700 [Mycobacterium sp.]|nr:hypothetical protein [Mycobacterium sp.]